METLSPGTGSNKTTATALSPCSRQMQVHLEAEPSIWGYQQVPGSGWTTKDTDPSFGARGCEIAALTFAKHTENKYKGGEARAWESFNGESRAAPAGMFPILPLGHSGPWRSRGGCFICQTKVVNACLASSLALGGSDHSRLDVRDCSALGGGQSRTIWLGWEGGQHPAALLVPRPALLG